MATRWKVGYPPAVQGVYLVQLECNLIHSCQIISSGYGDERDYLIISYGKYCFAYHTHMEINRKRGLQVPAYCIRRHIGPFKFPPSGKPKKRKKLVKS